MAELTIQVPDELAQRLGTLQDRLPELLSLLAEATSSTASAGLASLANLADTPLAYAEVLDFLITRPTPREIVAFKVSGAAQARIGDLLEKNREETLNKTEAIELDLYEQLEHLMIMLKTKAYAVIDG